MEVSGILGFIILLLDIWAIVRIFGSSAGVGFKVLWTLLVVFLPVVGLVFWWFLGPK